ncbi:TPA: LacI family DNA-binding transcriptional regulator [Streptococcus suis]|uniref:LacI family regulatory protein n=3 Tax=Streptococcus suis TaxID=1307 RepID=A0A0H3MXQ3_STRS4|nr:MULTISPECIES: LacI family DNA-binding transcriptional regulator [Streptococcus]ABP93227.1 Transcriptional regulator [Streptococcus suis 98HAH33]ADV71068.1 transcriptional regulator [Streptococcus suis JS14]AER16174.1 transcriptional regulator [Streptococcus suis SS12]AER45199.1 transcriptional regulator [Streptococcus suis A7]AFR01292.1 transcriptional regulator [Streptococcus suis S735]
MTTLADVARLANVSKMTVSRVINHPEQVTQELRTLVTAAMEELNYKPNVAAKALAQQRTLIVQAVILEKMDVVEPYYIDLLAGIADELNHRNYTLQLVTNPSQITDQCDGYIVTGARKDDYPWLKGLRKPLILFGENQEGLPFVDSDNRLATRSATQFALSKGYERIVFVGIDLPEAFEKGREEGYKDAMQGRETHLYRLENRSRVAEEFVKNLDYLPENTCFICASDRLALGVTRGLQALGKSIPNDVGVIGFDGFFLDRMSRPALTTMKQPIRQMGALSVKHLMTILDGKPLARQGHYCQATLIERETTPQ